MTRQEHLIASRLSVADVGRLLDAVVLVAEPVAVHFHWRPMLRDPDDEMVLETAVNGRADRLVTFNRRDFAAAAKLFGLTVKTPGEVLLDLENDR
jgi:predicted nucleic acid-binding protein